MQLKSIRTMNKVGAVGLAVTGVALFFNKVGEQPVRVLVIIVVGYAALVALPLVSLRGLSTNCSQALRAFAIFANWSFIALWGLLFLLAVYTHDGIRQLLSSILVFVIPQAINIRALRGLNEQSRRLDQKVTQPEGT